MATINRGTGTTVELLTSGWTARLTYVQPITPGIKAFQTTRMSSTLPAGSQQGGHTYMGARFGDLGILAVVGYFNPQTGLPPTGRFEPVRVSYARVLPDLGPTVIEGTACLINFRPTHPYEELMAFAAVWQWSGILTEIAGSDNLGPVPLIVTEEFEWGGFPSVPLIVTEEFES